MNLRKRMLLALNNENPSSNGNGKFFVTEIWNEVTGEHDHEEHNTLDEARKYVFNTLKQLQSKATEAEQDADGCIDYHRYTIKVVYE